MHHFWSGLIRPILYITQPTTIIEVGCAYGVNTVNLLSYVRSVPQGQLFSVDPSPAFHVDDMKNVYGDSFVMVQNFSLQALPNLMPCDAIVLDGDHNWYTVYHELKVLENCERFPIVFLHDLEWPYGRRDMYYFPDSIPEQFRQPCALKGIVEGKNELVEGAFNSIVHNAEHENGERNGVLTAVEDFLQETKFNLRLHRAHSQHGLGIIIPEESERDKYWNQAIHNIIMSSGL